MVFVIQTVRNIYKENCLKNSKMFGLFGYKKRVDKLREEVQDSFNHVKKDFGKVSDWIKHLDDKSLSHKNEISDIKTQLLSVHEDVVELKDIISFFGSPVSKQVPIVGVKQTLSKGVQTAVQTAVQTGILDGFTVMERAIVWALLNSEMKLSYEDLSALLGKDKSTIRGQINTIKQKNSEIIMESREANGKKRLYIPNEIRSIIIKNVKIKVKAVEKKKLPKIRKSES